MPNQSEISAFLIKEFPRTQSTVQAVNSGSVRLIWLFLLLFGLAVNAAENTSFTRKSDSNVTVTAGKQRAVTNIVNTTFALDSYYDPVRKVMVDVLLAQRIEARYLSGREGADSSVEVVAWISGKDKFDTKLWSIKDSADDGRRWGDFYRTSKYGCCGAEDVHRAFDPKTGKYVFSFTADPVFVDVPSTPIKRNISYLSAAAASGYEYQKSFSKGVGVLTISGDGANIDQVIIETDDEELRWSPKLALIDARQAPRRQPFVALEFQRHIEVGGRQRLLGQADLP